MRATFTPEEVDLIESKAYETGLRVGAGQERERVTALIETLRCGCGGECDMIEVRFNKLIALIRENQMLSEDELDDLIADTNFQQGRDYERERIRSRIKKRIEELSSCNKDDDCAKIADYIESYLPEWVWE